MTWIAILIAFSFARAPQGVFLTPRTAFVAMAVVTALAAWRARADRARLWTVLSVSGLSAVIYIFTVLR